MTAQLKLSAREVRRRQTRERILGAAITKFKRAGMIGADVGAIVTAAGVVHGTFYFHFPSKEHVLLELESGEERRIASEFADYLNSPWDLATALVEVVDLVRGLEERFGAQLFRDILAQHFSSTRPRKDDWTDPFFLLGIYGVLTTTDDSEIRSRMLAELVASAVRGLEIR